MPGHGVIAEVADGDATGRPAAWPAFPPRQGGLQEAMPISRCTAPSKDPQGFGDVGLVVGLPGLRLDFVAAVHQGSLQPVRCGGPIGAGRHRVAAGGHDLHGALHGLLASFHKLVDPPDQLERRSLACRLPPEGEDNAFIGLVFGTHPQPHLAPGADHGPARTPGANGSPESDLPRCPGIDGGHGSFPRGRRNGRDGHKRDLKRSQRSTVAPFDSLRILCLPDSRSLGLTLHVTVTKMTHGAWKGPFYVSGTGFGSRTTQRSARRRAEGA